MPTTAITAAQPNITYEAFTQSAPGVYAALIALGKASGASCLEQELIELVKLRVSQINGCAFCLQHHLNIARSLKVENKKLDLVAAWRDAGVFSQREMAALSWAEALTKLDNSATHDQLWQTLREQFTETEAIFLTSVIGAINAWNRLGVGFRFAPPV